MCTLMEKDALIERVASVQALIARKTPRTGERTPDQNRIVALRRHLYFSSPEEISFEAVKNECNTLYQKYTAPESANEMNATGNADFSFIARQVENIFHLEGFSTSSEQQCLLDAIGKNKVTESGAYEEMLSYVQQNKTIECFIDSRTWA